MIIMTRFLPVQIYCNQVLTPTIFKFPFKFDINGLKFNIKLSVKMYVDLNNVFQELEGLL
jgi:hypothetical protein